MKSVAGHFNWSDDEYSNFGRMPQISRHGYHSLPLFTNNALIELLDAYPRRNLQAYTMGLDPTRSEDWKQVDIALETTGTDLWAAVSHGRLWLNLTHIETNNPVIGDLIDGMYQQLGEHCPNLKQPRGTHSALLISSPGAQVYYHLDAEPNMLWHLRGTKTVWLYPAMDSRLVPQNYLEDIYAGERGENLPYSPEFDAYAQEHQLIPGDAASWPHNGPHRIVNDDLNVSLATSYTTKDIYRRQYVQLANRYLLRDLGIRQRSMSESGPVAALKRFSYRAINRLRPFKRIDRTATYLTNLQVDPNAPLGYRQLSESRLASFAAARKDSSRTTQQNTASTVAS